MPDRGRNRYWHPTYGCGFLLSPPRASVESLNCLGGSQLSSATCWTQEKVSRDYLLVRMQESLTPFQGPGHIPHCNQGGQERHHHVLDKSPILEGKKLSYQALNQMAYKKTEVKLETPSHRKHSLRACFGAYHFIFHLIWSNLTRNHLVYSRPKVDQ